MPSKKPKDNSQNERVFAHQVSDKELAKGNWIILFIVMVLL